MRNIIFRGLTTSGSWVFGSLVTTNKWLKNKPKQHTKTWIVTKSFGNGGWFSVINRRYVRPETVGQFTGLLDSNNKPIYENDIIKDPYGNFAVVTWHKDSASFFYRYPIGEQIGLDEFGNLVTVKGNTTFDLKLLSE